jgi:hypothetical protein
VAAAGELVGLLGRAAEQRRPQARPDQQDGDGGAEGARTDYGGATWMLARIANGGRLREALPQLGACDTAPY